MPLISSKFKVAELDCPAEEQVIRNRLGSLPGLSELRFNYITRQVEVEHEESRGAEVEAALREVGLTVQRLEPSKNSSSVADARSADAEGQAAPRSVLVQVAMGLSGILAVAAEAWSWSSKDERSMIVLALSIGSVLLGGVPTLRKGLMALRTWTLNINFLMTIAVAGAFAIGEYPEAAMVTFLFGLAELIEAWALERARNAIQKLLELAPDETLVQQPDGSWKPQPSSEVRKSALVRVRPGERIALDGVVKTGSSTVNESPITGESMPVDKSPGMQVFAGTINGDGLLEFVTTGGADETTLARIVQTVQDAQSERAPTQRFVDRFALYYTPVVCVLAILVAVVPPIVLQQPWDLWIYRALVMLVVACPCALVISTPVTIVSGLTAAAQHGILIKGGTYLEGGQRLRTIALDKTGTITEGRPKVTDVLPLEGTGVTRDDVIQLAASLDAPSQHPVAQAVTAAWSGQRIEVGDFQSLTGRGVQGSLKGKQYVLGNHRLAEERKVCSPAVEEVLQRLEGEGKTVIVLADESRSLGVIGVADRPRETSVEAIRQFHDRGIKVLMLSGDNERTADAIGREVGIDDSRGNLLPEDKLTTIEQLLKEWGTEAVAMVGDGVNDAPALAKASIGFAMGVAGTDTAIETADVALMKDDLRGVTTFFDLSQMTGRVLTQNIVIALGAKLLFFVLTLFGWATLWMAVLADVGASLIVIANGLRLLAASPDRKKSVDVPPTSGQR